MSREDKISKLEIFIASFVSVLVGNGIIFGRSALGLSNMKIIFFICCIIKGCFVKI